MFLDLFSALLSNPWGIFLFGLMVFLILFSIASTFYTYQIQGLIDSKKASSVVPGAIIGGKNLKHVSGLPIAKNACLEAYYCPDKFVFIKGAQAVTVSMDKVVGVDFVKNYPDGRNREMVGATIMAGALAGNNGANNGVNTGVLAAAALGSAMVGCLVITYVSDDEVRFIALDASKSRTFAREVKKEFLQTHEEEQMLIEL